MMNDSHSKQSLPTSAHDIESEQTTASIDTAQSVKSSEHDAHELLRVDNLKVDFSNSHHQWTRIVHGISFTVGKGEILGIVGESGCGKSVTAFSILRLHERRTAKYEGSISFEGHDIFSLGKKQLRTLRGGDIGFIFQNPMSSLNPLLTIGQQLRETVRTHHPSLSKDEVESNCIEALKDAGSDNPESWMKQYPYQFSGGMLQRVMIGMALINHPKLLIADEPTTALDVTIQMQLLKVLRDLRKTRDMSIILITHDMGVVAQMCDRVEVMYKGRIMESAPVSDIFAHPRNPYTQGLLAAIPPMEGSRPKRLKTVSDFLKQSGSDLSLDDNAIDHAELTDNVKKA
ncbi:ABC transporter ATP-binding protein [Bifidobacterium aquikefiricola]|uniref:ABC transporter ATP-binding protein n=1 Tax=Bifidobacterium aquikefiricola TaxID=3059038 RepID=A0AB39U5V6_9BIFI